MKKKPIKIFLFLIFFFFSNNVFSFNYKPIHEFEIFRNNKKIGFYKLSFQNIEDKIVVNTQIEMIVKLGIIPIFKYFHEGKEIWINNKFIEAYKIKEKQKRSDELSFLRESITEKFASETLTALIVGDAIKNIVERTQWF